MSKSNSVQKILLACFIFLMLVSISSAKAGDKLADQLQNLQIITEEYPPISFTNKHNQPDGLAVDIVKEIMQRLGMNQQIEVWPWARGYSKTVEGPNYVLFSASRTKEREALFHWVGGMFEMRSSFYAKKNSGIKIRSLDDARDLKLIGTYRESFDQQFLLEKGFTNMDITSSNLLNMKKLMHGRFDVITATNITIADLLNQAGYQREDVEELFSFIEVDNYIVFSKQVPIEVVNAWEQAFMEIKEEGILKEIQQKWLE